MSWIRVSETSEGYFEVRETRDEIDKLLIYRSDAYGKRLFIEVTMLDGTQVLLNADHIVAIGEDTE